MRYDYVKAIYTGEWDRAQELGREWYDTFQLHREDEGEPRTANVKQLRRLPNGEFLWSFEAWGPTSENVSKLNWALWAPMLQRLDVRDDITLTHDGIDRVYQHLRNHKNGNKNVTMYDSRQRSKRQGRDTGGYGIGIGSHKSDLRTTFYVRGFEGGACEFQFAGDKLAGKIAAVGMLAGTKHAMEDNSLWYNLQLALWSAGWADTQEVMGMQKEHIEALSRGDVVDDFTIEQQLAVVDGILNSLPKDAMYAVLESVQLRLL